ncbi:uncharacterized protein N0V96_004716 [Colletotrichum fioriniae]|uniref:uncharacterized protein n=1 Tax=Colletotrichum fioriniae TaxID=710243 RepID=UPI0032DA9F32|nr:hypothetical protein N0V96_004716 [Colletotrichum fioriniae]
MHYSAEEKRELIKRLHPHLGPATFEELVYSEQVSQLIWEKLDRLLSAHAVWRPGQKWAYETNEEEAHRTFIRIECTPAADEAQMLESLQTFQVEAVSSEQVRFALIAAVCYRNETTPVYRIRLFTCRGIEPLPHYEGIYSDTDWEFGAVGHTYLLLYVRSNIPLAEITPHMHNIIACRVPGTHEHVAGDERKNRYAA